jgi:flagella basal body P-ring formation protein FlgA
MNRFAIRPDRPPHRPGSGSGERACVIRMAWLLLIAVVVLAGPHPGPARAESFEDPENLRRQAIEFAQQQSTGLAGQVNVTAAPLDTRLRLPACSSLERYLPSGSRLWGRAQVGLRCTAPQAWSVLIPVHVRVEDTAVISARPLAPGQPLSEADIQVRTVDLTQLPAGVLTDAAAAVGRLPRVAVAAGVPIRGDMLRSVPVISQGQVVGVLYRADGLSIRAEGKALGAAAVGQTVQIRMPSGKVVLGTALGPGEVEVR